MAHQDDLAVIRIGAGRAVVINGDRLDIVVVAGIVAGFSVGIERQIRPSIRVEPAHDQFNHKENRNPLFFIAGNDDLSIFLNGYSIKRGFIGGLRVEAVRNQR